MIDIDKSKDNKNPVDFSQIIIKSTILALILTIPSLGIFLMINSYYNDIIFAAFAGFGIHFVILAFSGRISKLLEPLKI